MNIADADFTLLKDKERYNSFVACFDAIKASKYDIPAVQIYSWSSDGWRVSAEEGETKTYTQMNIFDYK